MKKCLGGVAGALVALVAVSAAADDGTNQMRTRRTELKTRSSSEAQALGRDVVVSRGTVNTPSDDAFVPELESLDGSAVDALQASLADSGTALLETVPAEESMTLRVTEAPATVEMSSEDQLRLARMQAILTATLVVTEVPLDEPLVP